MLAVGAVRGWPASPSPDSDRADHATLGAEVAGDRPTRAPAGSAYTIVQMNLCLSGLAECYDAVAYPAGVDNAVARIRELRADAVTITEACRHDAESMAARLGYDSRFARVRYGGRALHCVNPSGRGLFGIAILTRSPIVATATRTFAAQYGPEQRRWMCATTRRKVDVCAAHLETPYASAAAEARDAQCAELADVLAHQVSRAIVFGGDVNRQGSCAPPGAWERADDAADQAPGIQQVYGSGDLRDPTAEVLPSTFSDHDMLVVHARLTPR